MVAKAAEGRSDAGFGAFWHSALGLRLLKSMLLFGTVVALGLSVAELYLEYRSGVAVIERRLDDIAASHAEAAADRLWAVDPSGIELVAKGIASLPAIRYVEIYEVNVARQHFPTVVVGERPRAHPLPRTIPLVLHNDGRTEVVGQLYIEATLEDLYSHLVSRGWLILGEQTLKSFLLAAFFLFVVQRLVVSRLSLISSHLMAFGGVSGKAVAAEGDEIDRMRAAFEEMRDNIAAKRAKLEAREREYRTLAESSPDNIIRYDREGRVRYLNARLAAVLGLTDIAGIGKRPTEIGPDRLMDEKIEQAAARTCETGETIGIELSLAPGVVHHVLMVPERDEKGAIVGTIAFGRDISDSKRLDSTLRFIADPAGMGQDGDFLSALARHLSETLGVAYVIIDRLDEQLGFAESVALCAQGEIQPNMRYALAGTPCAGVADSQFCFYPRGVQDLFPEDALLVEMGVHSYAGTPLLDTTGKPIGLIAVLDTAAFQNESLVTQILRIVTPRAAAELERAESDRELALREQQYRVLAESAPEYIIRYDRDHRIRYLNAKLAEFLSLSSPEEVIGKCPSEAWPDGRFNVVEQTIDRAMESGEAVSFEMKIDGRLHHTVVVPERDKTGSVVGTILFGRDVTELVRIEGERQRLQHAVNQSADSIFVIDGPSGRIVTVNDAACRSLGYSRDEFKELTVADIDPQFFLPNVQQEVAVLALEEPRRFESHHRAKDGRIFPVEITSSLFEENGERQCISIARDITGRKRLEEELIQREQQFRSLAENSPDVIVRYDRQGRRIYVNPAYENVAVPATASVLGKVPDETWRGSISVEDYLALIHGVVETGSSARTRMMWKSPGNVDDIVFDLYVVPEVGRQNEVSGALVIGRDITRLVEVERQFHTLVENLPDNILRLDRDLRILFANGPVLAALGCGLKDVLGKTFMEMVGDDHPKILDEAARRVIAEGRSNVTEVVLDDKAPPLVLEVQHVPEFDDDGHVTSVLGVGRNISERKAREKIERQLMQAQKFEALGQLAGNVAHDFNNLLGAILGFADLIVDETSVDDPSHQLAARIVAAGDHGRGLVSQILTFARRSELQLGRVPLAVAIEETKTLLAGSMPTTARMITSAEEDAGDVTGDLSQIVHLLVNLCINAQHALDGGHGEIAVTASRTPSEGETFRRLRRRAADSTAAEVVDTWCGSQGQACAVAGCLTPDHQYRVLTVSDTGCGMDEALLGQAFTPFFTTKGSGHGTGLGLAAVHGAVLAHGGALAVESRSGAGTRFEIYLPAASDDAPLPVKKIESGKEPLPSPVVAGARILLVDDDPHFCDMLFAVLERWGFEVAPCFDPRDALEAIDEFGCTWDVLVTDQTMPHLTGIELIRAVRERCPGLPCILCTGFSEANLGKEVLAQAGVSALLRKPLDLKVLKGVIAQALAERRGSSIG